MADAMVIDQTTDTGAKGGVADNGSADTSKVQVPGYVKGQLAKETSEALLKEIASDPKLAARLPKGTDELFKSWRTLEKESSSAVRLPAKDAPKEVWDQYYKAIGRPESPDGYAYMKPNLPNGLPYSDKLEKCFRQELFEAGVPQSAAEKIFNDWNTMNSAAFTANTEARKKADEEQRKAATKAATEAMTTKYKDTWPQMKQLRDAAIARFGGQELVTRLQSARLPNGLTLDNDPLISDLFIEIGKRMDNDQIVSAETGGAHTAEPRPGLPRTPGGYVLDYPGMERDSRFRVKAE